MIILIWSLYAMSLETVIDSALSQFPTLREKIGKAKLLSIAEKNQHLSIIYYLTKSIPDNTKVKKMLYVLKDDPNHIGALVILDYILRPHYILKHLDRCLATIQDESRLNALLEHLLNANSFWQGYCEIEVAAHLKKMFGKIELEPSLNGEKKADVKFSLNCKDVFVEVTAPKRHYKYIKAMQESAEEHKVVQLEAPVERASDKILDELNHFADKLDKVNSVIIINLNDTEIEDIDIEDALMGTSKLVVLKNISTGKIETRVVRENWTAFVKDNKLAKVGAIICYKRDFAINGNVAFEKRVFALSFDKQDCEYLVNLFPELEDNNPRSNSVEKS